MNTFLLIAAEVAPEVASGDWVAAVGKIGVLAIEILGPIVLVIGGILLTKLLGKAGIEKAKAMDDLLQEFLKRGLDIADAWARKQAGKPAGDDKLTKAVDFILPLIRAAGLPELARDKLEELVEAKLMEEKKGGFHVADERT